MTDFFAGYVGELTKKLAYEYWQRRGCPVGSPEVDWFAAEKALAPTKPTSQSHFSLYGLSLEPTEEPGR